MAPSALDLQTSVAMFVYVSEQMVESKDLLTQADKAIGDGDHGVGMARGFAAVRDTLTQRSFGALDELLNTIGLTLMTSVGGAAGAIFGTFFRGGGANLAGQQAFDAQALALFLQDGLSAVQARGKAAPGDKTMVDALEPAARVSRELASAPLHKSLGAVAEAARQGMASTRDMLAAVGKAKPLGERALGHPDPGAISTYLLLKFMDAYVTDDEERR